MTEDEYWKWDDIVEGIENASWNLSYNKRHIINDERFEKYKNVITLLEEVHEEATRKMKEYEGGGASGRNI